MLSVAAVVLFVSAACSKEKPQCDRYIRVSSTVEKSTKASRNITDNLTEFGINAISGGWSSWAGQKGDEYMSAVPVKKGTSGWSTCSADGSTEQLYYWVENVPLYFWSFAPSSPNGTFEITSQSTDGKEDEMVFSFTPAADVEDQEDFLLGFNREKREFSEDGTEITGYESSNANYIAHVNKEGRPDSQMYVSLHHALSEVSFCVSTSDDTFSSDLSILSIQLSGVAASGACTFLGEPDEDETFFNWTPAADTTSYTLVLNTDFASDPASDDEQWSTGSYTMTSRGTHNLFTTKSCMYVIPQDLSQLEKPRIKVTFKRTSNGEVATKAVAIDDEFLPGFYYKYKINAQKVGSDIYLSYVLFVNDWIDGTDTVIL